MLVESLASISRSSAAGRLAAGPAGLRKTHRHPRHIDVPKLVEPGNHVVAQPAHVEREVEAG